MSYQPPATKESYVYDLLKSQILSGELLPGARLVQQEIAERFTVSPIPVREALGRLLAEGLVERRAHFGVHVARLSKQDLEEILYMRAALETLAARVAVPHLGPQAIQELRGLIKGMREALQSKEFHRYGSYNKEFHLKICEAAPYRRLYQTIVDLWALADRYRGRTMYVLVPGLTERSLEGHVAILEAVERRDAEAAASLTDTHKRSALKDFFDRFEERSL